MDDKQTYVIMAWVEAMGKVREEEYDTGMTKEEWNELGERGQSEELETWAYNEVQMGWGWRSLKGWE